jgi:2-C-methyl-D-erythritol 2,4-cyclodiphosphate synthase
VRTRVGMGFDVHAFASGRRLVLGGILIPFERGLAGHSDADALIHAVVDALLGAAALGDMGTHFPSTEGAWKGQASRLFLEATARLVRQSGWEIENVDSTIVAERPRLAPHTHDMRVAMAQGLGIDVDRMSIKAKTTDGLGFVGREEGIACYATALLTGA